MDKLKEYWEIAKKQHFWILCGLAILAPLIASVIANNYLSKVYGEQKSKITSTNSKLDSLISGEHANEEWVKHVNEETERLRTNVLHAWDALYNKQKTALKWPPELQADFIAAFEKSAANDDPRVLEPLCERYQNYVKTELSHMADIVKAEWNPGQGGAGAGHAGPGARRSRLGAAGEAPVENPNEPKKTYIVSWDPADQERLVAAYDWQDPPSPLDVRYAQEELWVLEAICKAIDRTNVGATADFDAVVREIHGTLIGYDATNKFPLGEGSGRIDRSRKTGPGGQMAPPANPQAGPAAAILEPTRPMRHRTTEEGALSGLSRRHPGGFGHPNEGAPNPGVPAGPADPDSWLKDGRYVDSKGKPLLGSEWAASTSPEYNQMAFKLTIVADEQRWQSLLLEFCNSPLPLEVREVRINPSDSEEGGGRGRPGRPQGRHEDEASVLHNVTLEIHGVAYLINKPDPVKLGIKGADATAGPTAPANVAPPAATPAATTPATAIGTPATPPAETSPTPATGPATTPATTTPATTTPPPTAPATAPAANPATATLPATTTPATVPPNTAPPTTAPPTAPPPAKAPATTTAPPSK